MEMVHCCLESADRSFESYDFSFAGLSSIPPWSGNLVRKAVGSSFVQLKSVEDNRT